MSEITAEQFIAKVIEVSRVIGALSNTGAMEFAGNVVSVLGAHPEHIARFMEEGAALFHDGTLSYEHGCLSFTAINGTINTPANLRKRKGIEQ